MKKLKKKPMLLGILALLLCLYLLWENTTVGLTSYQIQMNELPPALDGYKIAHVSDLHNSFLWKQTVSLLRQARPDMICITGDMVDSRRTDVDKALAFAAEAVQIAPCYYIAGNHELRIAQAEYKKLLDGLQALGVHVLRNTTETIEAGDARIAVTGAFWGSSLYLSQWDPDADFRLLLAHAPEEFSSYASGGFDLVLTGHAHGGQFRIPYIGGIFAPGQGIFPEYDSGVYQNGYTQMVVSRGIGNSIMPVRVFNRPELVILTLKSV